ncbi:M15 family metallopeptidase [Caballeronia sp. LZ033]|uniref:M15 family metallopeptidase n=1 Tax=Caballeronia sp. LZ033 TaxID=3038566 RepID=UPI00285BB859|nr:M15 family metallopeptidase [Caballeronia sp. LZ033]MDR5813850.1 M15 family metallopeptidase [Caballeronia sp. LZ033]
MPSRQISDCHPALQPLATQFLAQCKAAGLDVILTCTYRSGAEQNALCAQGRAASEHIVTNAKAGQSRHNTTLNGKPASTAFDFVPLDAAGQCIWNASNADFKKAVAIGKSLGLEWAGDWRSFVEYVHFSLPTLPASVSAS